ncbi:MAG: cation:proton antiporter [Candidatus Latescibacteria bacterium]|nr:cation:proton antiporter [Candidatus Latescibacterota bacterium]
MRLILVFIALSLLMAWAGATPPGDAPGAYTTLVVGLLLLSGYAAGHVLSRLRLPRITGYLCVGMLAGPYLLGFLTDEAVSQLGFLNELAVTFIALAAGGELRVADLKDRMRVILLTILSLTAIVFTIITLFVWSMRSLLPFTSDFSSLQVLAVGMLFGVLAVARSPSSAIAIINETRALGPFTETALGVTVVMDVFVIVLFAAAISFCEVMMSPAAALDLGFVVALSIEVLLGIGAGVVIGLALGFYIDRVRANLPLLLLGTALLVTSISHGFAGYLKEVHNLAIRPEPLLICVTAGFTVQNVSRQGSRFIEAIESVGLPVYVLFFTLAGAGLNLEALMQTWTIAVLLVGVRAGAIYLGAYIGGRLGGAPPRFNRIAGMAYLTQAGVSLGLALEVTRRFPGWGDAFVTVIVAVIAVNQMIGPIAMKQALTRAGETREA